MIEPTTEGMRRYPETSGYNAIGHLPCTCLRTCLRRCAGECGCDACRMAFTVFCDEAGLSSFDPWTDEDRKNALSIYRDTITPFPFHPTLEGFRRYPDTNGRYAGNPNLPCKCVKFCEPLCDGSCGCEACETAFKAFCDASELVGPDGAQLPSSDVLSAYRKR